MAQINLVTGYTGEAHVKSEDDALLTRFLLGTNNAVLRASETHTTTAFNVSACDAIINGRLVRIDEPISFSMTPPSSGSIRTDAVYVVYSKDNNGVETAYLDYVTGTSSSFPYTPAPAPSHGGVTESSFRIYQIQWSNNQTITEVTVPPSAPLKVPTMNSNMAKYSGKLTGVNQGVMDVDLGYASVYRIPLVGNSCLNVGVLSPSSSMAVANNGVYRICITPSDSFGGTVFVSGADVQGGDALGASTIYKNLTQGENSNYFYIDFQAVARNLEGGGTTGNLNDFKVVFWFITINDFE